MNVHKARSLSCRTHRVWPFFAIAGAMVLAAACGPTRYDYPEQIAGSEQHDPLGERPDAGRGHLFTGRDEPEEPEEPAEPETEPASGPARPASAPVTPAASGAPVRTAAAVNPYMWRAALDTLSGLPVITADPQGGAIITDWHSYPETPNRRVKAQAYVLSGDLKPSALSVRIFWQERQNGAWMSLPPSARAKTDLEAAILTRAWSLRNGTADPAAPAEPFRIAR